MAPLYPYHTPSKSLEDRLYTAEFDDALIDQIAWKNIRYKGSKIKTKEINKFTSQQTASAAETGIGFASIVMQGAAVGEMVVEGSGQSTFTIGGYFANSNSEYPDPTGLPGIFAVSGMNPSIIYEGDSENPLGIIPNLKNETTAL